MSKIRQNFVSNSSSSSFIIYGINTSMDDVKEYAKLNFSENPEYQKILNIDEYEQAYQLIGFLDRNVSSVRFICDYEDPEFVHIGREFKNIKDDETGKMFKDSVEEFIKESFPQSKCRTIDFEICS